MKKMLLLSLMTALSIATFSATAQVTAQLNVIDPGSEISLNLSSTSAAFGDVLITQGEVKLPRAITFTLSGTRAQKAHIHVPKSVELTSGTNKITARTELTGTSMTAHNFNDGTVLSTDALMNANGGSATGTLQAKLTLAGTELPGNYTGVIPVHAIYN